MLKNTCEAKTKKGVLCTRIALPKNVYCYQHNKIQSNKIQSNIEKKDIESIPVSKKDTCKSKTATGEICDRDIWLKGACENHFSEQQATIKELKDILNQIETERKEHDTQLTCSMLTCSKLFSLIITGGYFLLFDNKFRSTFTEKIKEINRSHPHVFSLISFPELEELKKETSIDVVQSYYNTILKYSLIQIFIREIMIKDVSLIISNLWERQSFC